MRTSPALKIRLFGRRKCTFVVKKVKKGMDVERKETGKDVKMGL